MTLYRGVNGVNRTITSQQRGVSGVNREIQQQYRGVAGVNRLVFSSGYDYEVYNTLSVTKYELDSNNAVPSNGDAAVNNEYYTSVSVDANTGALSLSGDKKVYSGLVGRKTAMSTGYQYYLSATNGKYYELDLNQRDNRPYGVQVLVRQNITYSRGSLVKKVRETSKSHPENGRDSNDGYWYVFKK